MFTVFTTAIPKNRKLENYKNKRTEPKMVFKNSISGVIIDRISLNKIKYIVERRKILAGIA